MADEFKMPQVASLLVASLLRHTQTPDAPTVFALACIYGNLEVARYALATFGLDVESNVTLGGRGGYLSGENWALGRVPKALYVRFPPAAVLIPRCPAPRAPVGHGPARPRLRQAV